MKTNGTIYRADGKKVNVFIPEKEDMNDEVNPDFIFQSTATELLVKAVRGEIDIHELAWQELRSRGLTITVNGLDLINKKHDHERVLA